MDKHLEWLHKNIPIPQNMWELIEPSIQGLFFFKSLKMEDLDANKVCVIALSGWIIAKVRQLDEEKFQEIPHPVYLQYAFSVYENLVQLEEPEKIWDDMIKWLL